MTTPLATGRRFRISQLLGETIKVEGCNPRCYILDSHHLKQINGTAIITARETERFRQRNVRIRPFARKFREGFRRASALWVGVLRSLNADLVSVDPGVGRAIPYPLTYAS